MMTVKLLGWFILFQVYAIGEEVDFRRPVWNIAHMVNAIYQADYYLDSGANTLEFDVAFDNDGNARFTFHGVPCDCFRSCVRYENIEDYLDYMRQLTTPGDPKFREKLVLLFLDLKLNGLSTSAKVRAGSSVARMLLEYYWKRGTSGARANVLLSIPSVYNIEFVRSFRNTLKAENFASYEKIIGYDFSGNEDLNLIRSALISENITDHIWQGDGITNCLPRGKSRVRDAIARRDQPGLTYVDKVYWWTVDKMSTMRATLRLGIDGLITNYPERLVSVLEEGEFSRRFRMATIEDNPWNKYPLSTSAMYADDEGPTARGGYITADDGGLMVRGGYIKADVARKDDDDELLYNC